MPQLWWPPEQFWVSFLQASYYLEESRGKGHTSGQQGPLYCLRMSSNHSWTRPTHSMAMPGKSVDSQRLGAVIPRTIDPLGVRFPFRGGPAGSPTRLKPFLIGNLRMEEIHVCLWGLVFWRW